MTEAAVLALGVLLTGGYFFTYSFFAIRQVGPDYAAGSRDEKRELTGVAARVQRALDNQLAALVMYGAAAAAVSLSDSASGFTAGCAMVWLAARCLYLPLYAAGAVPWRSIVWGFGLFACLGMAAATLL